MNKKFRFSEAEQSRINEAIEAAKATGTQTDIARQQTVLPFRQPNNT